jgi:hypothetical protein
MIGSEKELGLFCQRVKDREETFHNFDQGILKGEVSLYY